MESVRLIENFVSWQGEGPDSGCTMIILRFKTCNLKCSWCDTAVKMRISAEAPYQLTSIQKTINDKNAGLLITGGEPTVNRHFNETSVLLNSLNYPIANVESNGFKLKELVESVPKDKPVKFIYSPKIFNEKDLNSAVEKTEELSSFDNVFIKVVYEKTQFIDAYLKVLYSQYESMAWNQRIWLMPEGSTRTDLIRNSSEVFDVCERYGFSFSSRSHIMFGFV